MSVYDKPTGPSVPDASRTGARGLWAAIDRDRFSRPRTWLLLLGVVLLAVLVWKGGLALALMFGLVGLPLLFFIDRHYARQRNQQQGLAAISDTDGTVIPKTIDALHSMALAAGVQTPELLYFGSDGVNAHVATVGGRVKICVSLPFSRLPRDEQEAGLALLIARHRVGDTGRGMQGLRQELAGESLERSTLATWLEQTQEADSEGLLILKDPLPIMRLLARLQNADTAVRGVSVLDQSVFGYLAWPCALPHPRQNGESDSLGNPETARLRAIQHSVAVARSAKEGQ